MIFRPGDRITTPTHRTGIILPPPWTMPCHCLVQLDSMTSPIWILTELLELLEQRPTQPSPVSQIGQLSLFQESEAA